MTIVVVQKQQKEEEEKKKDEYYLAAATATATASSSAAISSASAISAISSGDNDDAIVMRKEEIDDDDNNNNGDDHHDDDDDDDDDEERGGHHGPIASSASSASSPLTTKKTFIKTTTKKNENDNNYTANSQGDIVVHEHNHESTTKTTITKTKTNKKRKRKRKRKFFHNILFPKCIRKKIINFLDCWPRLVAIMTRQLLVYALVVVTLCGGYIMSVFEGPTEISNNNIFLQKTWFLKSLPLQETTNALVGLPTTCLSQFIDLIQQRNNNNTGIIIDTVELESNNNNNNNNNTNNIISNFVYTTTTTENHETIDDLVYFADGLSSFMTADDAIVSWKELYNFANDTSLFPNSNNNNNNNGKHNIIDFDLFELFDPSLLILPTLPPPPSPPPETETETTSTDGNDDNSNTTSCFDSSSFGSITDELYDYMISCEEIAGELLNAVVNFTVKSALHDFEILINDNTGNGGLTFNWIRCWNDTELGRSDPFKPSQKQIDASLFINQAEYFTLEWNNNRIELYENYTNEYGCNSNYDNSTDNDDDGDDPIMVLNRTKCYWEATKQSVLNASGKRGCDANTGSSAWFWFTVMTTVGYGNFSPNTQAGRVLVYCLGWLSIIAFGGIIYIAGYTYATIADDLFRRFNIKWLQRPEYSAPLWGVFGLSWICLVALKARQYWDTRVPSFDYTVSDSYWFSYITVLTVGLGDFFLQPQGMFISDVFQWTTLLLHGFVFISSFLGKFGDLLTKYFPSRGESFEYHLARTDLWGFGKSAPISKSLEILKQLVETEENFNEDTIESTSSRSHKYRSSFIENEKANALDERDGNTLNYHRIRVLIEKKNLLIRLLEDAQSELEDRVNESLLDGLQNNDNNNDDENDNDSGGDRRFGSLGLHHVSRSLTTVEDLQYEERVLESTLFRTKEVRTQLEEYRMKGRREITTATT